MKNFVVLGAFFGALAVVIGAFGAHALRESLSPYELGVFATGSNYQFYHSLALVLYGLFGKGPRWPAYFFAAGILLFSGSLYALALFHAPRFGMITPLGGLAFIIGWVGFAVAARK
jgi:uncharacterized membrane protein YgdD (TMEM256/DUF423 family)